MNLKLTITTLAALLSTSPLIAQQKQPGQSQTSAPQANQNSPADTALLKEQALAKCLEITNQEQVAITKFAKEKATSEEVKALATTLEKAHQQCLDDLKAIATKAATGKKATTPASSVANNNACAVDFLQMHQEMSDQCLKDSKDMLSKKQGAEFDACFVGMQIAKHGMMHSSLTVLQKHTTGELQGFVKAGLVKNDEHMQAATSLMEKLSEKAVTKTAKNDK